MMNKARNWLDRLALGIALGLVAGVVTGQIPAARAAERMPGIKPPEAVAYGMNYGQWSAAWWQHVLGIAKENNPLHDRSGQYCGRQQSGPVWFLVGDGGGRPVTRTCTVPGGKAIFFPIINVECSSVERPPFFGKNERELRACVGPIMDGIDTGSLKVEINGVEVPLLQRYRMQSGKFDFVLRDDNILGVFPSRGSAVSDGYWLMLEPLQPGWHVIHFEAKFASGIGRGVGQNVTYNLIVTEERRAGADLLEQPAARQP